MARSSSTIRHVAVHPGADGGWHYALPDPAGQLLVGQLDRRFLRRHVRTDAELAAETVWPSFRAVTSRLAQPHEASLELVLVVEDLDDGLIPVPACIGHKILEEPAWDTVSDWRLDRNQVLEHLHLPDADLGDDGGRAAVVHAVRKWTGVQLPDDDFDAAWVLALLVTFVQGVIGEEIPAVTPSSLAAPTAASTTAPARSEPPDRFVLAAAPGDTLLSVADVAALYGVSRSSVYELRGKVATLRFGGLKFKKADIDTYLAARARVPLVLADPPPPSGMPIARRLRDEDEVVPGLTRAELKRKAGF